MDNNDIDDIEQNDDDKAHDDERKNGYIICNFCTSELKLELNFV